MIITRTLPLTLAAILLFSLAVVSTAHGQNASSTTEVSTSTTVDSTTGSTTETTTDDQTASTTEADMADSPTTVLDDRAKERITNLAANTSNRMESAVARLQNITDRLNSRMTKLEEAGLNVSEARGIIASAQTSLTDATNNLATIDVDVNNAVNSENPQASWQAVKTTFLTTQDQLRTAYQEIKLTIGALKTAARDRQAEQAVPSVQQTQPATTTEEDGLDTATSTE